jgi:hypothetical protein
MYDGSLYGNWKAIVTFQQMIVLCNEDGIIDMTPQALAARTSIPLEIIREGIELLEAPDQYSRTRDHDGRRIERIDADRPWGWRIINYRKYRMMITAEQKREADRNRMAAKREAERRMAGDGATGCDETRQSQMSQNVAKVAQAEVEVEVEERKGRRSASLARPKDVSEQTWTDWLALRRSKKAPVTATVLAGAEAEAEKAGMSLDAFLREWVLRGSQGMKAEWLAQRGADQPKATGRDGKPLPEWAIPGMSIL